MHAVDVPIGRVGRGHVRGEGDLLADGKRFEFVRRAQGDDFGDALFRFARPFPFQQSQAADVGAGRDIFHADDAPHDIFFTRMHDRVRRNDRHDRLHLVQRGERFEIGGRQPKGAFQVDVEGVFLLQVGIHSALHVRRCLHDADQEPDPECDDRHDGKEPAEPAFKFFENDLVKFFHAVPSRTKRRAASPLDDGNVRRVFVHRLRDRLTVLDLDDAIRHLRDRGVVRDDDDRLLFVAADIMQKF